MTTTIDTTEQFSDKLNTWKGYHDKHVASEQDLAELILLAESAKTAEPWLWADLRDLLIRHGGLKNEKTAKDTAKRCQMKADLGVVPWEADIFVKAFLESRGYTMKYIGSFLHNGKESGADRDYIGREMKLWNEKMDQFSVSAIDWSLDNWMHDEGARQRTVMTSTLRFDPSIDPQRSELKRLVRMLVAPVGTPEENERNWLAAETAFASFIYRVKNHVRGIWKNSAHLMPILLGVQGDGKSEFVKHLCRPLQDAGMFASVGFDAFEDNDQSYQLSVIPVWMFEEMSGISKADVSKLKAIMTDEQRLMRAAYGKSGVKRVVTTFIACTNEDISEKIKDPSGNRRFIQFTTNTVPRKDIHGIDALKIWRSIDEDAVEPPQYETPEIAALIREVQQGQRYQSPVEHWLLETPDIPWGEWLKATKLWLGDGSFGWGFQDYLRRSYGANEINQWSAQRLGYALKDLCMQKRFDIKMRSYGGSNQYWIECPHDEPEEMLARKTARRLAALKSLGG